MTIEDGKKDKNVFYINEDEINDETREYYKHFSQNIENSRGAYILDKNNEPVQEPCYIKHSMFMANEDRRRLAFDEINDITISTVFLGTNHQYGDGPPILFETMVFGMTADNSYQERYYTYDEALIGHANAVKFVRIEFGD